jgi:hypothetical protein
MILSFFVAIDPFLIIAALPFIGRIVQLRMSMSASCKDFHLNEEFCWPSSGFLLFC